MLLFSTIRKAARKGNRERVAEHLRRGDSVDVLGEDGLGPLHWAALNGDVPMAELLLTHGASVNLHVAGLTPFYCAVREGHVELMNLLLARGAASVINLVDASSQETPLHRAMALGPESLARMLPLLLAAGADLNANGGGRGGTPLHIAVERRSMKLVRYLTSKGATIDAKDTESGATPLMWAVRGGRAAKLWSQAVVTGPLDEDEEDRLMSGALFFVRGSDTYMDEELQHYMQLKYVAESAGAEGSDDDRSLRVCKCLLEIGADVNARNKDGGTTLHLACESGLAATIPSSWSSSALGSITVSKYKRYDFTSPELVRFLLDAGADVDARDGDGRSPLHLAAVRPGAIAVADLLIKAGAKVDAADARGQTPLHCAAGKGNQGWGMIELLLRSGANVAACDSNGRRPVMCMHPEAVKGWEQAWSTGQPVPRKFSLLFEADK